MTDLKIQFNLHDQSEDELEDVHHNPGAETPEWEPLERYNSFGSNNGRPGGGGRRPTIFAIGENWDYDESKRKLSRRPSTSSNSSLGMENTKNDSLVMVSAKRSFLYYPFKKYMLGKHDLDQLQIYSLNQAFFDIFLTLRQDSLMILSKTSRKINKKAFMGESECGETWKSRARRRNSVIPVSMGIQPWVKQLELLSHSTTSPSDANAESTTTARTTKKRRKYEDIKSLVKAGKLSEAKGAVRDGDWDWTEDLRSRLWPFLESVHESSSAGGSDYWETVRELFGHARNEVPEFGKINIPSQCGPASICGIYYQLDERGVAMCHRVVSVVIYGFPDITYCPWLVPVASLFLHYLEEEKVHSALCNLLSAKHKVFLTQTKLQFEVCSQAAHALTKKFSKSTHSNLVRHLHSEERIESLFENWSWWIWRDLPLQHLVRIMDCFLMEGIKVLYRVSIGVLNHFVKNQLPHCSPEENMSQAISNMCKTLELSPLRLLKSAFSIRNFRSAEIRRVTTKLQFTIKSEGRTPKRNKSTDSMPNSKSQVDICTSSKTINNAKESNETIPMNFGSVSSLACTREQLLQVWQWLPLRITMYQPLRIYTTDEDGCSLTNFFNRVEQYEPTLLMIKATSGEIFGAYLSTAWVVRNEKDNRGERQRYFGTGECFLFGLTPVTIKYPWVGIKGKVEHAAELFMHADSNGFAIGGGEGTGIQIDSDLRFGKTEKCLTFNNEPLVQGSNGGGDFEVQVLEVFAFTMD